MDRPLFILYFMLLLLMPFSVSADEYPTGEKVERKEVPSAVSSTRELMYKVLDTIPDSNLKHGLKDYSDALGLESYGGSDTAVGGSNAGMGEFFGRRYQDKKNSCVRDAAQKFYRDVGNYLRKQNSCNNKSENTYESRLPGYIRYGCESDGKPKLTEAAGDGRYANLEPGWVWKLALKNANGDANAALLLVGMCGHDDMSQGTYKAIDKSSEGQDRANLKVDNYRSEIKRVQSQIDVLRAKNSDKNDDVYQLMTLRDSLSSAKGSLRNIQLHGGEEVRMNCPDPESGFYAAKSLDESADIPKDLKNELQEAFSEDGATKAGSKYYHVYGSAFMACQLVQNGVSPNSAALIQQQAARVYRGIRMCQFTTDLERITDRRKEYEEKLAVKYNSKDPVTIVKKILAVGKILKNCEGSSDLVECDYLQTVGIPSYAMDTEPEFALKDSEIRAKVNGALKGMDAAELYRSWYLGGGKIAGKQLPCSDVRVLGPTDLKKPTESFFGRLSKPSNWIDERYKTASKKLNTWDADFKWTIAEHKAGADFAGKVCKKRAPGEKPLKGICPNGPPDGVTRYEGGDKSGPQQNQSKKSEVVQ